MNDGITSVTITSKTARNAERILEQRRREKQLGTDTMTDQEMEQGQMVVDPETGEYKTEQAFLRDLTGTSIKGKGFLLKTRVLREKLQLIVTAKVTEVGTRIDKNGISETFQKIEITGINQEFDVEDEPEKQPCDQEIVSGVGQDAE